MVIAVGGGARHLLWERLFGKYCFFLQSFNPDKFRLILLGLVMPRRFLLAAAVTAPFLVGESTATEEASLVTLSNSWPEGQPIPSDILVFRDSEGCLALSTGTVVVFAVNQSLGLVSHSGFCSR